MSTGNKNFDEGFLLRMRIGLKRDTNDTLGFATGDCKADPEDSVP